MHSDESTTEPGSVNAALQHLPDAPGAETSSLASAPVPAAAETPCANRGQPAPKKLDRKSRARVARLPKAVRDRINAMLRDGSKQKDIIAQLGADAQGLTQRNLSDWYHSPSYQLWLAEQEWREDFRADHESASDLLNDFDSFKFNQATLQLAITRLYRAFRHLESGDLNQGLGGNAQSFARLVTALARACRETTNLEKFRQVVEALALKARQAKREGSSNPLEDIVREWDKTFGHQNAAPLPPLANGNNTTGNDNPATPAPSPSPVS